MSDSTTVVMAQTAGIDLGDRYSHFEVVGANGETVAQGRFRTTAASLERTFGSYEPMRIAFETGTHVQWVEEVLGELGQEGHVANARKVGLIWKNNRKSDKRDPTFLARLARLDPTLLSPVTLRSSEAQDDLVFIRARDDMVATRKKLINAARHFCASVVFAALNPPAYLKKTGAPSALKTSADKNKQAVNYQDHKYDA